MSLTKLSLAVNNFIIPGHGRVWLVTSRLGTGKIANLFYSIGLTHIKRLWKKALRLFYNLFILPVCIVQNSKMASNVWLVFSWAFFYVV
jgi:hypothetical protein